MRDLLTGLAILLIVALTAALVAPYFIDWNGQRAFVEARLSQALGQKVTIGGAIDVKLLPTPYLVLGQTVIGSDDGPVRIGIHHLALELAVPPLLHGEFDVVDARLEEPTIRVTLEQDRTLPALPDAPAFRADVSFDRISVADGTLAFADPQSGRTFVLDNLDFDADAPSLGGPFKGSGTEGPADAPTKFRFATTTADHGRTHAQLTVEATSAHAGVDLDGTLALTSAGRETIRQSFDGKVTVSGRLDEATDAPIAWTLTGPLKADPEAASLDGGELRLGDEAAGLTLDATAKADLGTAPELHLDLSAKQLDIDRLAGAPPDATTQPSPPKLPPLGSIRQAIVAATPPLPTHVDVSVDTATWGGETLSDLAAHFGVGGAGPEKLALSGDGPGGARVGLDGLLAPARFAGHLDLAIDDLPAALGWLGAIDPAVAIKASDIPFHSVKAKGSIGSDRGGVDLTGLSLDLDRSVLTGTARLAFADGAQPAKITADLRSSALDLDSLPDVTSLRDPASPFDLDLRLDARAIKVASVGDGALAAGHIGLALAKTGRNVVLSSFHADGLGAASFDARGNLDPQGASLTMTIDASRLEATAKLVHQLAPGDLSDALVARAGVLAPAKLQLDAGWRAGKNGALEPTQVRVDGRLGATAVTAGLRPGPDVSDAVALDASIKAPEGSILLRQLGVPTLPLDNLGASQITVSAHGAADQPLDTKIEASLGATTFNVAGGFTLLGAPRGGTGTVGVKSPDLSPLLQSLALAFPDMTGRISADATGSLTVDPRKGVAVGDLRAHLAETAMTGALRWNPQGADQPALTGTLDIDRLSLASLFALALGPSQPASQDAAWSHLAFATGLVDPPRGAIALKIKTLDLAPDVAATNAALDLAVAPNLVTIRNPGADLDGGRATSTVTLRRDGQQATFEGKLALDRVTVRLPALATTLTGTLDLAGSGTSAAGLVASLAGTGTATGADTTVAHADPTALPRVFAEVEADDVAVDEESVVRALQDAARAPLDAGTLSFALSLAGGVLQIEPKDGAKQVGQSVTDRLAATLDLRRPSLATRVEETLTALPKNWTGAPPSVVYATSGAPRAPSHSIDADAFINAVAARALARETARIEAYEFDIRERAFFNERLQSERRREQDRQALLEAARAEKARKEAAAKAAQEAANEAARQKAAQDKANRDSAPDSKDGAPQNAPSDTPGSGGHFDSPRPGHAADPSAAGRY